MKKSLAVLIFLLSVNAVSTKVYSGTSELSEILITLEILRDAGDKCIAEIKTQNTLGYSCKEHQELMLSFINNTKKLPKGSANEVFDKDPELENRYFTLSSEIDHSYSYITQWIKLHPNQKHNVSYGLIEQAVQQNKK